MMVRRLLLVACIVGVLQGAWAQAPLVAKRPMLTSISPLSVTSGQKTTMRFLGINLVGPRRLFVRGPGLEVRLAEVRTGEIPKGLEAKEVGETQFEATLDLPEGFADPIIEVVVECESTRTSPLRIPVRRAGEQESEREPNNGFAEAQTLVEGRPMLGAIQSEKDVDVFVFEGVAGVEYEVGVVAGRRASLLDGVVSVFDGDRRMMVVSDDGEGPDPVARFKVQRSGPHYAVVTDAADKGGVWCGYELLLRRLP